MNLGHRCSGRMSRNRPCWYRASLQKRGKWWCRKHLPHDYIAPFLTDDQIEQMAERVDLSIGPGVFQDSLRALIRELRYFRNLPSIKRLLN